MNIDTPHNFAKPGLGGCEPDDTPQTFEIDGSLLNLMKTECLLTD